MIEYAIFNGSIQIFQYLKLNNTQLTPSLWFYSIHCKNPEIIHILEENHESIKERIDENTEFNDLKKINDTFIDFLPNDLGK